MKRVAVVVLALTGLAACSKQTESGTGIPDRVGRYTGVGIYSADRLWAQLEQDPAPDGRSARLADDSYVVVVVDSHTGELRQCGNLSGHCIGMNPWSRPLAAPQRTPAPLIKHAADLEAEADGAARKN